MTHGTALITSLIDSQSTYFTANGRNRKCYIRLIGDPIRHPIYGYELNAFTLSKLFYCLYSENYDIKEGDTVIYEAKEYIIMKRVVKADKNILLLALDHKDKDFNV